MMFSLWRKALVSPDLGKASRCSLRLDLPARQQRLPGWYPAGSAAAAAPDGAAGPRGRATGWGIPSHSTAAGPTVTHRGGGLCPGPRGDTGDRGGDGQAALRRATSAALFFPFLLSWFARVSRPPCREDGARKGEAAFAWGQAQFPTHRSIPRSQPLPENQAAPTLSPGPRTNPRRRGQRRGEPQGHGRA